jgi:DNA mismatch repair protein MutH
MERTEALGKLKKLVGRDLLALAEKLEIPVHIKVNVAGKLVPRISKGWAGHTIERYLGLPLNCSPSPNFGSWELKVVPVRIRPRIGVCVKETMAITMIDPYEIKAKPFEDSHLYTKLRKMIVVARTFVDFVESSAAVHSVGTFDLEDPKIYKQVKADYELVRDVLRTKGFDALTGKMGVLVQPRTKGPGHGSISRAFYARTQFVAHILGLKALEP